MNRTKIEYGDYCFNPLEGCLHGCDYCYARRRIERFGGNFEPKYYPERLNDPMKQKAGKVLVGFQGDLFGDWVNTNFIQKVIDKTEEHPEHTFLFLTKNPKRYSEFGFPKNCWLGTTIDGTETLSGQVFKLEELEKKDNYKFISFEPLLGDVSRLDLSGIDLVIVGAMTGAGAIKPKKEWVEGIKHQNIFYKKNLNL